MTRNALSLLLGVLAVAVVVLGYLYYKETRPQGGVDIRIDEHGVTVEED